MHSALAKIKTVAERAAENIVDLLHFSSLDKMEQMVAWSSFMPVDAKDPHIINVSSQFERGQNGPTFTYDCSHKQQKESNFILAIEPTLVLLCQELSWAFGWKRMTAPVEALFFTWLILSDWSKWPLHLDTIVT